MIQIVGWDIGGANVKAARLETGNGEKSNLLVVSQPFEIWREKNRLPEVLRGMYSGIACGCAPQAMALTMTAELSDVFTTKREGVLFILESIQSSFPDIPSYALSLSGEFVLLSDARARPLDFAATNWLASAQWIAGQFPNCLLMDVGSTTTDILPILDGKIHVLGRTDPERLSSGELVFTGVLRTNLSAIVQSVPVAGRNCRVASEYFAISGDVHLILGNLRPQDYTCSTPDGCPPSVDSARRRLARLVCADIEMLSPGEIDEMAKYIGERQLCQIRDGLSQVLSRLPRLRKYPVLVVGAGAFLGTAAATSLNLEILNLQREMQREEPAVSPCMAVAHLLAQHMKDGSS
ncbi:MAG: H4MPT-linked C1 transfer pathway protein [Acidobacteria bacterium]|nr:H4MPT-linked C1 transfer pathway protein [Acidobacteriota bacterium]